MVSAPVRVLLVEDDPDDYELARAVLEEIPGSDFSLAWESAFEPGLAAMVGGEHDVCLVDYRLGKRDGIELQHEAQRLGCKTPVILLTGQGDREVVLRALQEGIADYLVKDKLDAVSLERSLRYVLQQKRHAAELERRVADRTAALEAAYEALRLADRRKNEFLALIAHELRNPLASISNAVHILARTSPKVNGVNVASEALERQVAHMVRLVDDLLDVGRISQGKMALRLTDIEINAVLADAVESVRPVAERWGHALEVRPSPAPIPMRADPVRLAQVVANLLANACKFTQPGGRIRVEVAREGGEAVIRVSDSGIGIAADHLPIIFDMFAQVDTSTTRSHEGLGIGLTLVKQLVDMHGGTVEARSEGLGRGSEFVVRLPDAPSHPVDTAVAYGKPDIRVGRA